MAHSQAQQLRHEMEKLRGQYEKAERAEAQSQSAWMAGYQKDLQAGLSHLKVVGSMFRKHPLAFLSPRRTIPDHVAAISRALADCARAKSDSARHAARGRVLEHTEHLRIAIEKCEAELKQMHAKVHEAAHKARH